MKRGWLSGTALAFAMLPDPLAGRKIELQRIDSREAVERLQAAFPDLRLILQIAQFRPLIDVGTGAEQPPHALRRNAGEAANVPFAVFDQQQSGIGVVVKRFYAARLDQEGLHAHSHSGRRGRRNKMVDVTLMRVRLSRAGLQRKRTHARPALADMYCRRRDAGIPPSALIASKSFRRPAARSRICR
ncbi:hypothetical protein RL2032 [Rhizobium johnstonii 3841]|uniref:Uncharacterized protein n=1 Tax=Rhizobium johnstonii (strain DSM 114642 / LMG 32736 / 3841) TaxID=216596 RepID=Q1MHN9_RHIJ3|nr:hypothetical protein RL2032 [Rhizobium johnstonii 3841]